MMVNPSVPAKTVPEFIAYAKANPGKINMSSPGIGSINHVAGELFKMMAGVDLVHVPYRGSQFPDLLAGQVQVTFNPLPSSLEFIRSGKLRALAVTTATRYRCCRTPQPWASLCPAMRRLHGLGSARRKIRLPKLSTSSTGRSMRGSPILSSRLGLWTSAACQRSMSPTDFAKFIAAETEKWAKVVKFAGIKPE